MNFTTVATTPQAAQLVDSLEEFLAPEISPHSSVDTRELRELLHEYRRDLETLTQPAIDHPRDTAAVTGTLNGLLEFWKTRFPHLDYLGDGRHERTTRQTFSGRPFSLVSPLKDFFKVRDISVNITIKFEQEYFLRAVGEMFTDAEQQRLKEAKFKKWMNRFILWYTTYGTIPTAYVWQNEWTLNDLRRFRVQKWDDVRPVMLELIQQKGHSAKLLSIIAPSAAPSIGKFLTPQQLSDLFQKATPTTIRQLFSLDTQGRQRLTPEFLAGMVEVGFLTGAEVKSYARTFGVPFTDEAFYERVIKAKKLYPSLDDYTPVV